MGVLCLIYLVLALRTNLVFVGIFLTLVFAFGFLSGSFWYAAQGKAALAGRLQIAGGAFAFVTCMFGWWIFAAIMLAALDFPFQLPGKLLLQLRVVALAVLTLIFQSVTCPTSSPEPVRRRTRRPKVSLGHVSKHCLLLIELRNYAAMSGCSSFRRFTVLLSVIIVYNHALFHYLEALYAN